MIKTGVSRFPGNPILTAFPEIPWASRKVYNPAIINTKENIHMIFRALGNDWVSRLGHAVSRDYIHFTADASPVMAPQKTYETHGIEDPRITFIDNTYVLAYTAYDGRCARLAIALSKDLVNWHRLGPVLPDWQIGFWQQISHGENNWSKAGGVFPKKFHGAYMMLFGDDDIWPAYSPDLKTWIPSKRPVLTKRPGYFDAGYIEMGPPPIKTRRGWLILYHGVQRTDDAKGDPRVYRIGAALLDLENPTQVIWRGRTALMEPFGQETVGLVDALAYGGGFEDLKQFSEKDLVKKVKAGTSPLALFACGAFLKNDIVWIYYSSMDTAINVATISLTDIFAH